MKRSSLCLLLNEPNTKDGFQVAMHKLGKRLSARNWKLGECRLEYRGFSFSKDEVTLGTIQTVKAGLVSCLTYRVTIEEAIDCVTGRLDSLLKYKP